MRLVKWISLLLLSCAKQPTQPQRPVIPLSCGPRAEMLVAFPDGRYKCCGPWATGNPDAIGPMACNRLAEEYQ